MESLWQAVRWGNHRGQMKATVEIKRKTLDAGRLASDLHALPAPHNPQ